MVNPTGKSASSPPPGAGGGVKVEGPVETGQHSTLGQVKAVDVKPFMAGKNLGKQLSGKGIAWILTFIKHPKATFDLVTGKLAKLRETDPVKYLEELCDLSSSKQDWKFTFDEGQRLKHGALPDRIDRLEGWQLVALGSLAEDYPRGEVKVFVVHLEDISSFASKLQGKIHYTGTDKQPDRGLQTLRRAARAAVNYAGQGSLHRMNKALLNLQDKINDHTHRGDSFNSVIDAVEGRLKKNLSDKPRTENQPAQAVQEHPPVQEQLDNNRQSWEKDFTLPVISEDNFPDELKEIQTVLLESPDDAEAWNNFEEIEGELTPSQIASFLTAVYKAHPDNQTAGKFLVFYGLPASPDNQSL